MPYYITTQQTLPDGSIGPVLPADIVNWAGTTMEDGRYLFYTPNVTAHILAGLTATTPEQAILLTQLVTLAGMATWFVPPFAV